MSEEFLDRLLADAAPRAPRGFAAGVMAELAARQRARRRAAWAAGLSVALAAAALVVMLRPRAPSPSQSWQPSASSGEGAWRLAAGEGVSGARVGAPLADGAQLDVAANGRAELRPIWAYSQSTEIEIAGPARFAATGRALRLDGGRAVLRGDGEAGVAVRASPARVVPLGDDYEVQLDLRRSDMNRTGTTLGAALLSIVVVRGGARVEASPPSGTVLLAAGDRALVADRTPPVALRAAAVKSAAKPPAPAASAKNNANANAKNSAAGANAPAKSGAAPEAAQNTTPPETGDPGTLYKDVVHAVMRSILPDVKSCYTAALAESPGAGGHLVLGFVIRADGDQGRVTEAEIVRTDDEDALDLPTVERCVLQAIRTAEFPAPASGGEVRVRYPIELRPN